MLVSLGRCVSVCACVCKQRRALHVLYNKPTKAKHTVDAATQKRLQQEGSACLHLVLRYRRRRAAERQQNEVSKVEGGQQDGQHEHSVVSSRCARWVVGVNSNNLQPVCEAVRERGCARDRKGAE